ncbi:hypothetical protein KC19_2G207700 [Ceratodon purpureus]|uniref:TF-B3 domain-containing protein n=1 Tax=Ceratodon purpureus TaxID=3225 RepID=A0A8T0IWA9_CERPU|nr:hypothetical protein KC19_2G207700 [Ceratodon purpureus]
MPTTSLDSPAMAELHNPSNITEVIMDSHTSEVDSMLVRLDSQRSVYFVIKKLRRSQVPDPTLSPACRLMIPSWFVHNHPDKLHESLLLRSGRSTELCRVHLTLVRNSYNLPEVKLGHGWRDFATSNRLEVGDALIFEHKELSEFAVHIFRATENSNSLPLSTGNGNGLPSSNIAGLQNDAFDAGCSTPPRHCEEPIITDMQPGESDQLARARTIHQLRNELQQPARAPLPRFTRRLVPYNIHDGVGNTCGAILEVPSSFLRAHAIQLEAAHVRLQGICEDSPVRPALASSHRPMHNPNGKPLMRLGWGDFVRENVLRAGQELVFTLVAESFFEVREVRGTAI